MRNISCVAVIMLLSITSMGQPADSILKSDTRVKRYHVNYYVTGSIIAVGMVSDYFAISRLKKKPKITSEEYAFITTDQQKDLINEALGSSK